MKSMVSVDFFTVPTLRFQILYVFLVLAHDRRRIVHFGVTAHPTAEWTVPQLREAFPWDTAPRYLLRDRDSIFGLDFVAQVKAMGIKAAACVEKPTSASVLPYPNHFSQSVNSTRISGRLPMLRSSRC